MYLSIFYFLSSLNMISLSHFFLMIIHSKTLLHFEFNLLSLYLISLVFPPLFFFFLFFLSLVYFYAIFILILILILILFYLCSYLYLCSISVFNFYLFYLCRTDVSSPIFLFHLSSLSIPYLPISYRIFIYISNLFYHLTYLYHFFLNLFSESSFLSSAVR